MSQKTKKKHLLCHSWNGLSWYCIVLNIWMQLRHLDFSGLCNWEVSRFETVCTLCELSQNLSQTRTNSLSPSPKGSPSVKFHCKKKAKSQLYSVYSVVMFYLLVLSQWQFCDWWHYGHFFSGAFNSVTDSHLHVFSNYEERLSETLSTWITPGLIHTHWLAPP